MQNRSALLVRGLPGMSKSHDVHDFVAGRLREPSALQTSPQSISLRGTRGKHILTEAGLAMLPRLATEVPPE